jgi:hypothetical protein
LAIQVQKVFGSTNTTPLRTSKDYHRQDSWR